MREKHRDEGSMDDDEECMESVAPVAEGTVPSGQGGLATIVEESCGKHAVSIAVAGKRQDEMLAFAG